MIDYIILEGANGYSVQLDPDIYPLKVFDLQYDSRNDQTDKVQQHGQWQTYDYLGRCTLNMQGNILGNSPHDYWTKRMAFSSVFNPVPELGSRFTVNARVKFTGISEETSAFFNLDGRPDIPINSEFPANSPFNVSLKAADPRFYGIQQSSEVGQPVVAGGLTYPLIYPLSYGTVISGGDTFITNAGNANSFPIIQIDGPVTNPALILDNSDGTQETLSLSLNGGLHIADNDSITVDMGARTVLSSSGGDLFSFATGDWWFLRPGVNHVRFKGFDTTTDTDATFIWSNAYLF